MLRNYFKIAWRNLWKNKFYNALNIAGLAAGLAVGILVLLWVQDELSYDRFHADSKNIYRVLANVGTGSSRQVWTGVPAPVATLAKNEVPEVKNAVRISDMDESLLFKYGDKQFTEPSSAFVDPSFFSVFDFNLLRGNPGEPFHTVNSVILTASVAKRYFGEEDPVGKTLLEENYGEEFVVDGVIEDFPGNSSINFDLLFPMSYYAKVFPGNGEWKTIEEDWGNYHFDTYLQLNPGSGIKPVEAKLALINNKYKGGTEDDPFSLQALAQIHLYKTDGSEGLMQTVRTFMLVAVFILLIASINYVNLSTARSMLRMKEISVRKITGASRFQLFFQFIAETALVFLFAVMAAFLLILLLLPAYNTISGKEMHISLLNGQLWSVTGLVVLSTLILSSVYPALLLSSSEPLKTLKGKLPAGINTAVFRKMLVTVQFVISVVLIAGTLIIGSQLRYIRALELGYDKSYVFTVPLTNEAVNHIDALKDGLKKQAGILNVSATSINDISNLQSSTSDLEWQGKPENSNLIISQAAIDKDFIPTMKIQLLEGSNLSGTPADSSYYILNETAVKEMGLKAPYAGQRIRFHDLEGVIRGVVRDFNFRPLKKAVGPLLLFSWWNGNTLYVRTTAKDAQKAIAATQQHYKKYAGNMPFTYSFVDEQFAAQYEADQRVGTLFNFFATIAIFISCLGLFGLATFTAQVKTKEIGIRKVLGASVTSVVALLSKDFIKLVLIAIIIATPLAWYTMNRWLEDFAYRIELQWWMFALAGLLAVVIALLTVSFQSVKAALMNPVKSLRSD